MRIAALFLGLALLRVSAAEVPASPSVRSLLKVASAALGKEWTVSYDARFPSITVKPVKAIPVRPVPIPGSSGSLTFSAGPHSDNTSVIDLAAAYTIRVPPLSPPPPPRPEYDDFVFTLRTAPLVTRKEHAQRSVRQAELKSQISELGGQLKSRGLLLHQKGEEFQPKTAADEVDIARYKALQQKIEHLPEFYFRNLSLTPWHYDPFHDGDPLPSVVDAAEREKCQKMIQTLLALFTRYPQ